MCLVMIWTGNACKMAKKKKKKGVFGEALFLTTSHSEVLVIDNKSLFYAPPFCKSWIHHLAVILKEHVEMFVSLSVLQY